jgi:hypothetical protein
MGHTRHDKLDPVTAFGIDHENLPVEIQKDIQGGITGSRHICHVITLR